ncbi:MAG: TlpA family protein disulfide reductase [Nocardioidaceae bacterium]
MRRLGWRWPLAVVAVAGLLVAIEALSAGSGSGGPAGRRAPPLPREALTGHPVTLATLRGGRAVINFWASWCSPCRKEAPELARLARELPDDARLVGVNWNDNAASARRFARRSGWRFPNLRDADGTVGNAYGLTGLPTTFVLDRELRIAATLRGPQTAASLRRALAEAAG